MLYSSNFSVNALNSCQIWQFLHLFQHLQFLQQRLRNLGYSAKSTDAKLRRQDCFGSMISVSQSFLFSRGHY